MEVEQKATNQRHNAPCVIFGIQMLHVAPDVSLDAALLGQRILPVRRLPPPSLLGRRALGTEVRLAVNEVSGQSTKKECQENRSRER